MQLYNKKLLECVGVDDGSFLETSLKGFYTIKGTTDVYLENEVFWYHDTSLVLITREIFEKMREQYLYTEEIFKDACKRIGLQYTQNESIPPYDTFAKSIVIIPSTDFKIWLERYYKMDITIRKTKVIYENVCHEIDNSLCYST